MGLQATGKTSRLTTMLLLGLACIACLAPFSNKALHIDDPLFVWLGQQIQAHPTDFFGFDVNWNSHHIPMWQETKNPPLAGYYLAGVAWVFGWSEMALHLAFLLPAVLVVWQTYLLAEGWCRRPAVAALVALVTPAFLVSSTNLMCDTLMLAFWLAALLLWRRGLERNQGWAFLAAGVLIGLGALTKYFAISLVPLLAAYTFWQRRRWFGWWLLALLVPLAMLGGYQWLTHVLYGQDLFGQAVAYASGSQVKSASKISLPAKVLVGLSFTGGCVATLFFYAPLLWSRRTLVLTIFGLLAFMWVLYLVGWVGPFRLVWKDRTVRWGTIAQVSLFAATGLSLLALAVLDFLDRRDPPALLLLLWVFGTFIFAALVNWTINGRSLLPAVPAAGLLVARRLDLLPVHGGEGTSWRVLWPLAPAAALALVVTYADYQLANSARTAANLLAEQARTMPDSSGKHWFEGHWGFQYYMEQHGAEPLDIEDIHVRRGDLVVTPLNNYGLFGFPAGTTESCGSLEVPACSWLATMHYLAGGGFYANRIGPLPFAFGRVVPEPYEIQRLTQDVHGKLELLPVYEKVTD